MTSASNEYLLHYIIQIKILDFFRLSTPKLEYRLIIDPLSNSFHYKLYIAEKLHVTTYYTKQTWPRIKTSSTTGYSLLFFYLIGPPAFIFLRFLQVPYGKFHRSGCGPTMSPPLAWFLIESPTVWLTSVLFPFGQHHSNPKALFLFSPFLLHYLHRTFLYPLRMHFRTTHRKTTSGSGGGFPVGVALMGFTISILNTYLQARWVSHYADYETDRWFWWRFSVGLAVFIGGMTVNVRSDMALLALKGEGGGGYKIPRGGWFEWVSCPNYFGEIVEWLAWAFMTWSWPGFGFFLSTCANLVPRARAHHIWYLEKFGEDYPKGRKAVIPFVY